MARLQPLGAAAHDSPSHELVVARAAGPASMVADPAAPDRLAPNDNAPEPLRAAGGGEDESEVNNMDSLDFERRRKRFATVAAQLAMRGFVLLPTATGTLIVSRWNLSRELANFEAADDFARKVGAA